MRRAGDRAKLAVMASDAYFPFPDGIQIAAQAGITAIIQPGGSIRDEALQELCGVIDAANVNLKSFSDEIYQELAYESAPHTALALDGEDLFVVNSFSKYFNMTGWRLGWMVAPERYVREIDKLSQNVYLSAPTPSRATIRVLSDARSSSSGTLAR